MAKLILFKRESCSFCKNFKLEDNYGALKKIIADDNETKDIQFYEFESLKDITGIKREIELARKSEKIVGVPTLCLFYNRKNWEIIDIDVWVNKEEQKRDINKIFENIKNTLTELKKANYKNKYIKYKNKYLELKNKYLQQK
jgi:thioredoxin-related protein